MKDDIKAPDDFGSDMAGWHELLGWGDGDDSIAPYVPTPMSVVRAMLTLIDAGPGDIVFDLGCGDGRILITAVEEFNVDRAVGYELNKHLVETALNKVFEKDLGDRIDVVNRDAMEADLSQASVVTLYLTTTGNAKLRPKFIEELGDGVRIVSHDFPIIEWTVDTHDGEPIKEGTHKLYLYKTPDAYAKNEKEAKEETPRWDRIKKLIDRL